MFFLQNLLVKKPIQLVIKSVNRLKHIYTEIDSNYSLLCVYVSLNCSIDFKNMKLWNLEVYYSVAIDLHLF